MAGEQTALFERVRATLEERSGGTVRLFTLRALSGGACQENFVVEARFEAGPLAGDRRMVLRSDAHRFLPGSLRRRDELQMVEAAVEAGVRTPAARWLSPGLVRDGADAYFLDWIDGEAIGRRVVRNAELEAARAKLPVELAENLARLHSVTPAKRPDLRFPGDSSAFELGPARAGLEQMRKLLDEAVEPQPGIEVALFWLVEHAPREDELVLVHGDFRTGNFMVTPEGLAAILDWEFAHWGSPYEDLAWISVRDWRFGRLDKPIGGFAAREPFYAAYERASGRKVDVARVHWWEVFGNVRWALGSLYQGERYLSGAESDLELLAIAQRSVEMEHEALRLIARGRW